MTGGGLLGFSVAVLIAFGERLGSCICLLRRGEEEMWFTVELFGAVALVHDGEGL